MIRAAAISGLLACLATGSAAFDIALPEGTIVNGTRTEDMTDFALPVAPWSDGAILTKMVDGALQKTAWRFPSSGVNTALIMALIRDQVEAQGFRAILDCADDRCGGFDFRYQIDILPEPQMHVDLGDYRFLSAIRDTDDGNQEFLQLVVSRSLAYGFVELSLITRAETPPLVAATKTPSAAAIDPGDMEQALSDNGFATLRGLVFESGSAELSGDQFDTLAALAGYLRDHPAATIALVGHTDATGGLDANMALSRMRARSIMDRLAQDHGISRTRMEADGVGYLAPIASNQTAQGRELNRRVEVVITSTN